MKKNGCILLLYSVLASTHRHGCAVKGEAHVRQGSMGQGDGLDLILLFLLGLQRTEKENAGVLISRIDAPCVEVWEVLFLSSFLFFLFFFS